MGNHKSRLERLEGGRKRQGAPIIVVERGETEAEAEQRHLDQHPEAAKAKVKIFISGREQDPSYVPPPLRPEPKESPQAPGPAVISITR